jgi:hypothetical protein
MKEKEEIDQVREVIQYLWDDGMIHRGTGHCIAMSDIVQKLLLHHGIDSYLQECSLMIHKKNIDDLMLVGYSMAKVYDPINQVKTHVVCVTKTKKPILIDLSVYNFVDDVPYICEYLDSNSVVDKFEFPNANFIYTKKYSDYQLPLLHERSIINRIETDKKIFNNFKIINTILIFISIIASINLVRGTFDFYQKYIIKDNGFGPAPKTLIK